MQALKPLLRAGGDAPGLRAAFSPTLRPERTRRLSVRASNQSQANPSQLNEPLSGHEWVMGLRGWMRGHLDPALGHGRSTLELAEEPLTRWMFRALMDDHADSHHRQVATYPAYLMAALLAPLAGVNPGQSADQINALVAASTRRPEAPWLTRPVINRLLCGLFGEATIHPPGTGQLPQALPDLRFWAAISGEGKLWVSDARWGEAGAFLIEYPRAAGTFPLEQPGPSRIQWDPNFKQFLSDPDTPVVLSWHTPPIAEVTPSWAREPRHSVSSLLDLMTSVRFEPVNLARGANRADWAGSVQVSMVDPQRRRAYSFAQEKSELLCHAEAWLAGLRFERQRRNESAPNTSFDAAELLSLVSNSIAQCAVEKRLLDLLDHVEQKHVNWASLHNLPEGEWLQGMVEDLLQAKCRSASCTFGDGRLPEATHQVRNGALEGLLQAWVTDPLASDAAAATIPTRQLHLHAQGRMFGNTPVTLTRDFVRGESAFPLGLRVVFGEAEPPVPRGARRLVFSLTEERHAEAGHSLEYRASAQREFWNAVLDFNPPGAG